MSYVKGDPYWLTLRYPATCRTCDEHVPEGSRGFYWPKGGQHKVQCADCGESSERQFQAEIAMETWS